MVWLAFYNLLLMIGVLLAASLSPFIGFWLLEGNPKYRAGLREKLGFYPKAFINALPSPQERKATKTVWFHAVSVGEVNALKPLIAGCIERFPQALQVVITTTTATGQGLARSLFPDLPITYCPFDFPFSVDRAYQTIQPDLLVLAETELWPNLIVRGATRHRCKVMLANARLSEKSFRGYRQVRPLLQITLSRLTHILAQSDADAERYRALGALAQTVQMTGNLKFDLPDEVNYERVTQLAQYFGFGESPILVFASTFNGEEAQLLPVYVRLLADIPTLKLVLAPRHPERVPEILPLLKQAGLSVSLRSQLSRENPNTAPVVILDTIGELRTVYRVARQSASAVAVVCGSFSNKRGGQNPLEPLRVGLPTVLGPNMQNFRAIVQQILSHQAAIQVTTIEILEKTVHDLLLSPTQQQAYLSRAMALFEQNTGATEKTVTVLQHLLFP